MFNKIRGKICNFVCGTRFTAEVTTGDRNGAGTDSDIFIQLMDTLGTMSVPTYLDDLFRNDHEKGQTNCYKVSEKGLERPHEIACISIWRKKSMFIDDRWLLEKIEVTDLKERKKYIFPVNRWILAEIHYYMFEYDTILPQEDKQAMDRKCEVSRRRLEYKFKASPNGGPLLVKLIPSDEKYSTMYTVTFETKKAIISAEKFVVGTVSAGLFWDSFANIKGFYGVNNSMEKPECTEYWKEDRWFGLQRLQGACAELISLCKEIPFKLQVTNNDLEPYLEGYTLNEAISRNKLFVVDLAILNGVQNAHLPNETMVAPIALFYLNKKNDLMPIAIQLSQEPSPNNPVFYPNDQPNTWLLAKMFFNMGEAQYHQSCMHLGNTHLMLETVWVSVNRNLSTSHPIFRLLAPHFIYLLGSNESGIKQLIGDAGWYQKHMMVGREGTLELISRSFKKWTLDVDGDFERQIESRGVLDPAILPNYPYRDDGIPVFNAIKKYVTRVIKYFYDTNEKLVADHELQSWVREMSTAQSLGGCGIGGIPLKVDNVEQLAKVCTFIISTSSLEHAVANIQQYETYAFPPNYPTSLQLAPPKDKEKNYTENDLVSYLPGRVATTEIMVATKIFSTTSKNKLGDFKVKYLFNPAVVEITKEFREELEMVSKETKLRNRSREFHYKWLDPAFIPNSPVEHEISF